LWSSCHTIALFTILIIPILNYYGSSCTADATPAASPRTGLVGHLFDVPSAKCITRIDINTSDAHLLFALRQRTSPSPSTEATTRLKKMRRQQQQRRRQQRSNRTTRAQNSSKTDLGRRRSRTLTREQMMTIGASARQRWHHEALGKSFSLQISDRPTI
jgi:hypothetical protein